MFIKFMFSKKATKIDKPSPWIWHFVEIIKWTVNNLSFFVAFLGNRNFNICYISKLRIENLVSVKFWQEFLLIYMTNEKNRFYPNTNKQTFVKWFTNNSNGILKCFWSYCEKIKLTTDGSSNLLISPQFPSAIGWRKKMCQL